MAIEITQVDAFTGRPFTGNPAAICLLAEPQPDQWMQNLAGEMNLSETAFLRRMGDEFELRWFTPSTEVDLCGHATLAAAHVLWESGELRPEETARFRTRSGLLTARREGDWIEMDFPATPVQPAEPPAGLLEALGVRARQVGRSRFDYLVEADSEQAVRSLSPDFAALAKAPTRGVIVTARAQERYDFVSRFFAPASGINEDPVTGSAHCCLGPYWKEKLNRDEFLPARLPPEAVKCGCGSPGTESA